MNKRHVSVIVAFSMLLSFFSFNYAYGEVVENGRVLLPYLLIPNAQPQGGQGYREIPYESKMYPESDYDKLSKPISRFALSLNGGNQQGITLLNSPMDNPTVGEGTGFGEGKSDFTNAILYGQKGDIVTMTNLSTARSLPMKNIHVQQHSAMFPVLNNTYSAGTTDVPLNENYKTLTMPGEYRYYLYAINTEDTPSDNGNHWASGASNTGSTAWRNTFFKQYFTAVKVVVPSIQVQEVYIDSDLGFTEIKPTTSYAKTWGESYIGQHKAFAGKVPDGVLIRYSWDSAEGYNNREHISSINVNLDASNPNLSREQVKSRFDSGRGLYFIVTYYYKNQPSSINVDFDVIHNSQNVNNSTIRVENFPLTINLLDKSTSQGGTINNWNWTRLNTQTYTTESFASIKNPTMTFTDEAALKKYLTGSDQMTVSLEARDTSNNIGIKTRTINFDIVKPGAMIEITGTASPVSIPYGQTWASGTVNFTAKAMDLAAGEVVQEWHTEIKTPRHEALGFRERINHNSTNIQVPRTVTTDISQTNRRVWLRAELKTNRGTYINEGYVDVPSSIQSQPPIAVIEGKTTISLGDKVTFDGTKSYSPDPNYFVEEYWWEMPGGTTILTKHPEYGSADRTQSKIEAYFTTIGTKTIELDVWNNRGVVSRDPARHTITVTEPFPTAVITVQGSLKENREVILDSVNSIGNDLYPIDPTKTYWTIAPAGGQSGGSIRVDGALTEARLSTLFKEPGNYTVRLYVTNTFGNSDMAERVLTIAPDEAPIANFNAVTTVYREPNNSNKATITLEDASYSVDSDIIAKRTWRYAYDDNNNGNFDDETWYVLSDANEKNVSITVTDVGKYRFELTVQEEFGQPTIAKFVTASDRRTGSTANKPMQEKIVEVANIAPTATFTASKKPVVDVMINITGGQHENVSVINSAINSQLIPLLEANRIEHNIKVLDNRPSPFTKIFFHAGNRYNYSSLFTYDFITQRVDKLDRSDAFGYNQMLASNGKLYYFRDTNSIDGTSYRRFSIYEYDLDTKVESVIYESPNNTFKFGGDFTYGSGGSYSTQAYIDHNNSIYYFESLFRGSLSQTIYLKKLDISTRATTILYSYDYNPYNHWTTDGSLDYRIVGVDKYNNLVLVTGFKKRDFNYTSLPKKEHTIRVIRPNGTTAYTVSHNAIDTASITMNEDGDIFYRSNEIINTGSPTRWTETKNTRLTINASGSMILNEEHDAALLNQYLITGFKRYDSDKLLINRYINGITNEYEYSLKNKTISSTFGILPHNTSSYLYGDNRFIYAYNYTTREYDTYLYNEDTRELLPAGLTMAKLAPYNIPSYSYYDEEDGWYDYNPAITFYGYNYRINMYANPSIIRIPDSMDIALEKATWRDNSKRFFINLGDYTVDELNDPKTLASIIASAISEQVNVVGMGTTTNQAQYNSLRNQLEGKGTYINNQDLVSAMQNLGNYIVQGSLPDALEQYLLLGESIEYEPNYEDKENDPMYQDRWKFTHNHTHFENPLGQIVNSGAYRLLPITTFDKVGKFDIVYSTRDNPKNDNRFDNYRLWSLEAPAFLYVHRRPIAGFSYSLVFAGGLNYNISLYNQSYDLDNISKANSGIVQEKWRYREINQTAWTNGKPAALMENKIYLVELTVKDLEGEWSYPEVKVINTDPNQMPPTITATPDKLTSWYNRANFLANGDLRVNVVAQAYGSKTITQVKYSWSQSITTPGTWTTTAISNFNLTQATDGRWYLHVQATDSTGLTANAVFGQYPVDKTPPTNPSITNNQNWTNAAQVPVTINHGTDAMSGLDKSLYRLTGATTLGDTTYNGQFNITNAGVTNIIAQTMDVAGNTSAEVTSVIRIDRTPPTIDANPQTYRGMSPLSVTITASDTGGSGFKDMRYSWTLSGVKPTSGWTTTSSPSAVTAQGAEGTWYLHMEGYDNAGNSFYRYRSYIIEDLKVSATLAPNPAMAGDQLIFTIDTEGYAERLEILVDTDIMAMDKRVEMGYSVQIYPITANVNGTINVKTSIVKYTLWVTTDQTLSQNNNRLRAPYKFTVRAWKGTLYKDCELELEVKGDIRSLIRPGIKNKN